MAIKKGSHVQWTERPDSRGFTTDGVGIVDYWPPIRGLVTVRVTRVYAYHVDHKSAGRYLPVGPGSFYAVEEESIKEFFDGSETGNESGHQPAGQLPC